jgi:hypothetical protein
MSLRNKLAAALARCDGCCLDDDDDRRKVLDTLQGELVGAGMNFSLACEALRWFVTTGETREDLLRARVRTLLETLGEI